MLGNHRILSPADVSNHYEYSHVTQSVRGGNGGKDESEQR